MSRRQRGGRSRKCRPTCIVSGTTPQCEHRYSLPAEQFRDNSAQHAQGRPPHAWFIGFTGSGDRQIAVAVIVEEGGNAGSEATGGRTAAPIARQVMQAYMGGG